jgi:hypothetical protein
MPIKFCPRALEIKEKYAKAIASDERDLEKNIQPDRHQLYTGRLASTKKRYAYSMNTHLRKCRDCG